MGKIKEIPRYNVVSLRVSHDEWKSLQTIAKELSVTISEMMRHALNSYVQPACTQSGKTV